MCTFAMPSAFVLNNEICQTDIGSACIGEKNVEPMLNIFIFKIH